MLIVCNEWVLNCKFVIRIETHIHFSLFKEHAWRRSEQILYDFLISINFFFLVSSKLYASYMFGLQIKYVSLLRLLFRALAHSIFAIKLKYDFFFLIFRQISVLLVFCVCFEFDLKEKGNIRYRVVGIFIHDLNYIEISIIIKSNIIFQI